MAQEAATEWSCLKNFLIIKEGWLLTDMTDEIGVNIILTVGDRKIEVTESEARALHKKLSDIFNGNKFTLPVLPSPPSWQPFISDTTPYASAPANHRNFSGRYDVKTVGLGKFGKESIGVSVYGGSDDQCSPHTLPGGSR